MNDGRGGGGVEDQYGIWCPMRWDRVFGTSCASTPCLASLLASSFLRMLVWLEVVRMVMLWDKLFMVCTMHATNSLSGWLY